VLVVAACSEDSNRTATGNTTPTTPSASGTATDAAAETEADRRVETDDDAERAPADRSDEPPSSDLEPFEPEPTTPVRDGADLDDVLREAATTTTTTLVGDQASAAPRAPLEPEQLAWTLRVAPAADDTRLHLLVDERGCDGSLDVSARLTVTLRESPDAVAIAVARTAASPADRVLCPTSPLTPLAIDLDARLGRRQLRPLDNAVAPAALPTIAEPVSLDLTVDQTPPTSATTVSSEPLPATVLSCRSESTLAIDWRPTSEFADPTAALAQGADAFGLIDVPWHQIEFDGEQGAAWRWVAAADGDVVAVLDAVPGVVGLRAFGEACPAAELGDAMFDDTLDDALTAAASERDAADPPLLALATTPGAAAAGLNIDGDALRFATGARCGAWVAWEDALLGSGYILGPVRTIVDPSDLPDAPGARPVDVPRQAQRRIDAPDGSAAIVSTDATGRITATDAIAAEGPRRPSRLVPCALDDTIAVVAS